MEEVEVLESFNYSYASTHPRCEISYPETESTSIVTLLVLRWSQSNSGRNCNVLVRNDHTFNFRHVAKWPSHRKKFYMFSFYHLINWRKSFNGKNFLIWDSIFFWDSIERLFWEWHNTCLLRMYILYFLYKNLHIWGFSTALSNQLQTCPECFNYLLHDWCRLSRAGRATYMNHQRCYCVISQCVMISLSFSLSLHLAEDLLVNNVCKSSLGVAPLLIW